MEKKLILSSNDRITDYILVIENQLILSYDKINLISINERLEELLSFNESILKSSNHSKIFGQFLLSRVSWVQELSILGIPEPTIYRILKYYEGLGVLEKIHSVKKHKSPGVRPKIWGLRGRWTQTDLEEALKRFSVNQDPGMALVRRGTQLILEEYGFKGEVRYQEVFNKMRPMSSGFFVNDIADKVAHELSRRGLRVWR